MSKPLALGDCNCDLDVFLREHPEIIVKRFENKIFLRFNKDISSLSYIIVNNDLISLSFIYKEKYIEYNKKM